MNVKGLYQRLMTGEISMDDKSKVDNIAYLLRRADDYMSIHTIEPETGYWYEMYLMYTEKAEVLKSELSIH